MSITPELLIDNKRLRRNFDFYIHREINSLDEECFIVLRKDYKDANNLSLVINSSLEILLKVNNSSYSLFKGKIIDLQKAENEFFVFALSGLAFDLSNKVEPQSFININLSSLLQKYRLNYESDYDTVLPHFLVSYESKREVVKRMLDTVRALTRKNIFYFIENDTLKISTKTSSKVWQIDNYVIRLVKGKLITFPLPGISLCDLVEYNNQVFPLFAVTMTKRNFCLSTGEKK